MRRASLAVLLECPPMLEEASREQTTGVSALPESTSEWNTALTSSCAVLDVEAVP